MNERESRRFSRRRFLQAAGGGAGIAALSPLLGAAHASASTSSKLRVGVLSPSGGDSPTMGANLVDGIRMGFDAAGVTASISGEDVPLGHQGAYTAATSVLSSGVDVVIAGITAPVARQLAPLFEQAGVPLVVANAGGHVVQPADRSDAVFHVPLGYWPSAYSLGRWAAANAGQRGLIATSLADGGYDAVFAYRRGLESAGGRWLDTMVTHQTADAGASGLADTVRASGAQHVFALYAGSRALDALRALRPTGVKVLAGAFTVDESLLTKAGSNAQSVWSASSWSPALRSTANRAFVKGFRARTGRKADAFAVVGYDAATAVATGTSRAGSARGLIGGLNGATIASPRGTLRVDAGTNQALAPLYLRQVRSTSTGLVNAVRGPLEDVPANPDAMSPLATGMPSGYLNEVLCPA
ncbi:MAG TPA: ABC transporter substrate-binding protein [Actinomycetota bacterium]|nr:ABC transporter substrate-binding protein [Actinomycetota bacterium]